MLKGIIFDFDGTLSSERAYIYGCFRFVEKALAERHGIENAGEKLICLFEEAWDNTFGRLFEQEGVEYSNQDIKELVKMYRSAPPMVQLYEDSKEVLTNLRMHGQKMALLTNGFSHVQREKLQKSGLLEYFDCVEIPDDRGREYWKPDTRCLEEILQKMKLRPDETIFVGDSNSDFFTAKKLGLKFFYIKREDRVNVFDYEDEADFVAITLKELFAIF